MGEPDLMLSISFSRSDEGIGAQVALDIGGDDLSRDAFSGHKPLVLAGHCEYVKEE
jgi:hypothetical protein